jgi:hypothetical protein
LNVIWNTQFIGLNNYVAAALLWFCLGIFRATKIWQLPCPLMGLETLIFVLLGFGISYLYVRCGMFDVRCGMFDVRCGMSDVGCQMSDVGCQMYDVRCRIEQNAPETVRF